MHAVHPSSLISLYLITLTVFDEKLTDAYGENLEANTVITKH